MLETFTSCSASSEPGVSSLSDLSWSTSSSGARVQAPSVFVTAACTDMYSPRTSLPIRLVTAVPHALEQVWLHLPNAVGFLVGSLVLFTLQARASGQ